MNDKSGVSLVWTKIVEPLIQHLTERVAPPDSGMIEQLLFTKRSSLVLVHGENPVCESMVIIEYIEEMWPQNPLMLNDPYDRALARFWIKFAADKVRITARANISIFVLREDKLEFGNKDENLSYLN
ncbi:hypothetical protein WN944_026250 [Citrus x changshan-huyou]|uniref:GST N-terminal domain-containing protein n=1 Tax=Citrus x changshan-huyou TaxID=2935761 RepID=A0AAP0LUR2_9ROSI